MNEREKRKKVSTILKGLLSKYFDPPLFWGGVTVWEGATFSLSFARACRASVRRHFVSISVQFYLLQVIPK
jgi:hypothetical protein